MFDWDGDGKHDWRDDALFHMVINDTDAEKNTHSSNSGGPGCLGGIIGVLLVLWIIGKLF